MNPVPAPYFHNFRSAEGWMELGDTLEALRELDQLTPELRVHPDVLQLRWQIYHKRQEWDACILVARTLTQAEPADPRGWISLAQSYYYQKRYQDAYDLAVSKITKFPDYWPIYYDAACYACLTERLGQARKFLQLAAALGRAEDIRRRASEDPDLKALWPELRKKQ